MNTKLLNIAPGDLPESTSRLVQTQGHLQWKLSLNAAGEYSKEFTSKQIGVDDVSFLRPAQNQKNTV